MDDQNMHEYGNHYDDDQLKPCPFCGAEAEIITLAGEDDQGIGAQCVQCTSSACGAASGLIYPLMDDVTDLLYEHWNKRFNAGVEPPPAGAQPTSAAVPESKSDEGLRDIDRAYVHGWNACREAMLAPQPPLSAAVPEGWRLVPIEPTQEMISASMRVGLNTEWVYGIGDRTDGSEIYEAMLAAAPPQPDSAKPLPLTDEQIESLREKTFSVNNPYCPVDSKSMRKATRAIEKHHNITGEPIP